MQDKRKTFPREPAQMQHKQIQVSEVQNLVSWELGLSYRAWLSNKTTKYGRVRTSKGLLFDDHWRFEKSELFPEIFSGRLTTKALE